MIYENDEDKRLEDNNGKLYSIPDGKGQYVKLTNIKELSEFNLEQLKQVYQNVFVTIQQYNMLDNMCVERGVYDKEELDLESDIKVLEVLQEIPIVSLLNTEELLEMLIREHLTVKGFKGFQDELVEKMDMTRGKDTQLN